MDIILQVSPLGDWFDVINNETGDVIYPVMGRETNPFVLKRLLEALGHTCDITFVDEENERFPEDTQVHHPWPLECEDWQPEDDTEHSTTNRTFTRISPEHEDWLPEHDEEE